MKITTFLERMPRLHHRTAMLIKSILVAFCALTLASCRGTLPGGNESLNKSYYNSAEDLKLWSDSLEKGMTKAEVFARLGRVQTDFKHLSRNEVITVLFGGNNTGVPVNFNLDGDVKTFLESLEGYRLEVRSVKKRHGFTSPIRVQTDAEGYHYILDLVFKDGRLYEKPTLTGGVVQEADSKTLFDYLNPGIFLRSF